jgi:hypothetical protein
MSYFASILAAPSLNLSPAELFLSSAQYSSTLIAENLSFKSFF